MSESKDKRLKIEMEKQMNVLDGPDSVKTGVQVIFALAGGKDRGRDGQRRLGMKGVQQVNL